MLNIAAPDFVMGIIDGKMRKMMPEYFGSEKSSDDMKFFFSSDIIWVSTFCT